MGFQYRRGEYVINVESTLKALQSHIFVCEIIVFTFEPEELEETETSISAVIP